MNMIRREIGKNVIGISWKVDESEPTLSLVTGIQFDDGIKLIVTLERMRLTGIVTAEGVCYCRMPINHEGIWQFRSHDGMEFLISWRDGEDKIVTSPISGDQAAAVVRMMFQAGNSASDAFWKVLVKNAV